LKTAGLRSIEVRQRHLKFSPKQGASVWVRARPWVSIHLAVTSPVSAALRPLSLWRARFESMAVGRSFRNANQVTIGGRPISLGLLIALEGNKPV